MPDYLPRDQFQRLLDALVAEGYQLLGPQLREGALQFAPVHAVDDFPKGVREAQAPGQYRLHHDAGERLFAWATGPQGLKPLLFAPREVLWRAEKDEAGHLQFRESLPEPPPTAVIGVRACDLAAATIQDQLFLARPKADPYYRARRAALFLVGVDCAQPADTCFCASTGDGPTCDHGYDIAMSELADGFLLRGSSERGEKVLQSLALAAADDGQRAEAEGQQRRAVEMQQRALVGRNLRETLFERLQHPRWDAVAARCLSCGNCTAVCPTCFCHKEGDDADLGGGESARVREWDSCFTEGHSYIHGIVVRGERKFRYRQWLSHKLGSWHDQFGRSGCVGCGRCITWCPVGIDITEEANAICAGENA